MMKLLLALTALCCADAASAQIDTPYLGELSTAEVCGGFNAYCQPTSSAEYDRVRAADFVTVEDWLGTSYGNGRRDAFNRLNCIADFSPRDDVRTSGENRFSVTIGNRYVGNLRSKLSVDLGRYLGAVLSVLPIGLQGQLKADATDALTLTSGSRADFTYRRLDLSMAAMSRLLPACFERTRNRRKVITGISVITMSGSWAKQRLIDSFGTFEASAAFIGLTPDVKARYIDQRNRALEGSFQPLSLVIATAWRRQ